jgi:hypothetical protein
MGSKTKSKPLKAARAASKLINGWMLFSQTIEVIPRRIYDGQRRTLTLG